MPSPTSPTEPSQGNTAAGMGHVEPPRATASSSGQASATRGVSARPQSSTVESAAASAAGLSSSEDKYDELAVIGNGAYGIVYRGRDKNNEGRFVALKKIRIPLTEDGVPVSAVREISLLKQLEKFEHPNIVRLLDIVLVKVDLKNLLNLTLVFEYVEQDLDKYLKKCPPPGLELARIKSLMHQILCGVEFLHISRIIHRDLKPQNLLIDKYDRVKITDFGLARIYDFHVRLTTTVVTLWYRAPEVLLSSSYATPVDMWSCGCIFAELFRRKPLFQGQTEGDQLQRIFDVIGKPNEKDWPKDVSLSLSNFRDNMGRKLEEVVPEITPCAADLLQKLLKFSPESRFSATKALQHSFFYGCQPPRVSATSNRSAPTQVSSPPLIPLAPTSPNALNVQQRPVVGLLPQVSMGESVPMQNDENDPCGVRGARPTTVSPEEGKVSPSVEVPGRAQSSPLPIGGPKSSPKDLPS